MHPAVAPLISVRLERSEKAGVLSQLIGREAPQEAPGRWRSGDTVGQTVSQIL